MGNLEAFNFDWDRALEAVGMVVLLAFLVERVVALVVETRWFVLYTSVPDPGSEEARREEQAAAGARDILAANDDEEVLRIVKQFEADSPLWMPNLKSPDEARQRAREYLQWIDDVHRRRQRLARLPLKEAIAFAVALVVCMWWRIDLFGFVLRADEVTMLGILLTAAVIAGGSKASVKLFHDLLGVRSQAVREMRDVHQQETRRRLEAVP